MSLLFLFNVVYAAVYSTTEVKKPLGYRLMQSILHATFVVYLVKIERCGHPQQVIQRILSFQLILRTDPPLLSDDLHLLARSTTTTTVVVAPASSSLRVNAKKASDAFVLLRE